MTKQEFLDHLRAGDFGGLFLDCLWDNPTTTTPYRFKAGEAEYEVREAAQKKGFRVYICTVNTMPDSATRRLIDSRLRKVSHDYLAIFVADSEPMHHLWSVPVKAVDKRQLVTVEYATEDQAAFLVEKMNAVSFTLDDDPTIIDVAAKVNSAFLVNTADVTKQFYQQFRKQHDLFVKGIENVSGEEDREWYASVMLNRLMFCYFIQKKGFLDFNEDYLGDKLKWVQAERGRDKFYGTFYKSFLKELFSGGLDGPPASRPASFKRKYGHIPYLNGGMFSMHRIEKENKGIDIPDAVFERLFAFFDQWRWHLDARITASGRDINPDVLGYIFEQYINDRAQMGAYYTKEDITEYIGRNTIVPWLLEKAGVKVVDAIAGEDADRYIFPAMRKGIDLPLPPEIEKGVAVEPQGSLRARRAEWNKPTGQAYALPTEIWRETVARRQRCEEIRDKFARGEIKSANDFITYNLDIRAFAEDVIRDTDDHMLVRHFYNALREITILDPTCGSGAFLFAALNILEPLYEVCLDRMEEFHAKNPRLFEKELAEMGQLATRNRQYFICKSIILRNLYGVDIMHEAVEIARLRLFLKMVAVVDVDPDDENLGLDPLPDIDFNIRCGNTLVGFENQQSVKDAILPADQLALDTEAYRKVEMKAADIDTLYNRFKALQQSAEGSTEFHKAKKELDAHLSALDDELDHAMARRFYNIEPDTLRGARELTEWKRKTQPFHWYSNFYGIVIARGGFDVIIGNPPYVEYSKVRDYRICNYKTENCGNLYAFVMEKILEISMQGSRLGMIIPISSVSNPKFKSLRELYISRTLQWLSSFSNRPGKLFEGVEQRLTIFLAHKNNTISKEFFSTDYQHWYVEERDYLFDRLSYHQNNICSHIDSLCKIGNKIAAGIWSRLILFSSMSFGKMFDKKSESGAYYHNAPTYFVRSLPYKPNSGKGMKESSHYKMIPSSAANRYAIACILNSSVFYWFYKVISNCRDFSDKEISPFPVGEIRASTFSAIGKRLEDSYRINKIVKCRDYSGSVVYYEEFYPAKSKPIIDEIDELLAKRYGFTEEELDFIINYDIKYRMGDELNAGE